MNFILGLLMASSVATTSPQVAQDATRAELKAGVVYPVKIQDFVKSEAILRGIDVSLVDRIVECESGYVPQQSRHINFLGEREDSWGIWQIHLPSHPEVSREQAMDPVWSTRWALDEIESGRVQQWSCY